MNGYDPEDKQLLDDKSRKMAEDLLIPLLSNKKLLLVGHFGRISQSDSSRLKSFYDLMEKIKDLADIEKNNVCFLFMGELTLEEKKAVESMGVKFLIIPPQNRLIAMASMEFCDALLLITGSGYGCVSGKIFEYIAAKKRIIHFSQVKNDASVMLDNLTGSLQSIPVSNNHNFSFKDLLGDKFEEPKEVDEVYNRQGQAKFFGRILDSLF